MRTYILLLFIFLSGVPYQQVLGQSYPYCLSGRFAENDLFNNLALIEHPQVAYGINLNYQAAMDTLRMTIFEVNPVLDNLPKRPLVVLLHGGEFTTGSPADMNGYASQLARRGFVAASVQYRIGWTTNGSVSTCTGDMASYRYAAYRALQDVHAALRFLVANAQTYGIDTSAVFILGQDAGAMTAYHVGYADQNEADAMFPGAFADLGGIYSATNSIQATYQIKGIFSWCGAVSDTAIFDAQEAIPVLSLHGLKDSVYDVTAANYRHCATYTNLFGPKAIHIRLSGQAICSETNYDANGEHCLFPTLEPVNYVPQKFTCFFKNLLCGNCTTREKVSYSISSCMDAAPLQLQESNISANWSLSPNPAADFVNLTMAAAETGDAEFTLISPTGLTWPLPSLSVQAQSKTSQRIDLPMNLASGMYWLECRWKEQVSRKKILIQGH